MNLFSKAPIAKCQLADSDLEYVLDMAAGEYALHKSTALESPMKSPSSFFPPRFELNWDEPDAEYQMRRCELDARNEQLSKTVWGSDGCGEEIKGEIATDRNWVRDFLFS